MSGLPRPVAPESDSFRPAEFSSVLIDAPRLRAGAARRRGRPVNASCYATQGNGEAVTNPLSARVAWVYATHQIAAEQGPCSVSVPVIAVTAWQGLLDQAQLKAGQTVVIHGAAGNVGAYAVQLARRAGVRTIATAAAEDIPFVRNLGADTVIDFRTQRFEEEVRDADAVIDLVGGETQKRSFQVLRRGGKLISAVSRPDQHLAQSHGVEAAFFLVNVTSQHLAQIAGLIDDGKLRTRVGAVLALADAREAHFMLEGLRPQPEGKIVLTVGAS